MLKTHIAYVEPRIAEKIRTGKKRVESRFYRTERPPFGRIQVGDRLHFRAVGGGYAAAAKITRVREFRGLTPLRLSRIRAEFGDQIGATRAYWIKKRQSQVGVLIWFRLDPMLAHPPAPARQFGTAWLTM